MLHGTGTHELRRLEAVLGHGPRLSIHSSTFGRHPVYVVATWPCGCRGEGDDFTDLELEPCPEHGTPRLRMRLQHDRASID